MTSNMNVKIEPSYYLDPDLPPAAFIRLNEKVSIHTLNSFGKNVSTEQELEACISSGLHHPLFGPVYVDGIEKDDGVEIEILEIIPDRIGYQCNSRSSGLLKHRYNGRNLKIATVSGENVKYQQILFPLSCSIGVVGLASSAKTRSGRAGTTGGNLDIRDLGVGTKITIKSEYPGGLIYFGDVHMLQGDGEISGIAVECGAKISFKVKKVAHDFHFPIIQTGKKVCFMGFGETLESSMLNAVLNAQYYLMKNYHFSADDAYLMLGAIGNILIGHATGAVKSSAVAIELKNLKSIEQQQGTAHREGAE